MRNGSMFGRVKVSSLLRFEELRSDRDGRPVPPEPTEKVRSAGGFLDPASWREVAGVFLQVEPIAARWNRFIACYALRSRITSEVEIERRFRTDLRSHWLSQIPDYFPHGTPWRKHRFQVRRGVSLPRWGLAQ